jgi:hypothetical protein
MKPKQIKLIKSLYKSADYERKEKIKECFPEVFESTPNPATFTIDGKTYLVTLIDENDLPV